MRARSAHEHLLLVVLARSHRCVTDLNKSARDMETPGVEPGSGWPGASARSSAGLPARPPETSAAAAGTGTDDDRRRNLTRPADTSRATSTAHRATVSRANAPNATPADSAAASNTAHSTGDNHTFTPRRDDPEAICTPKPNPPDGHTHNTGRLYVARCGSHREGVAGGRDLAQQQEIRDRDQQPTFLTENTTRLTILGSTPSDPCSPPPPRCPHYQAPRPAQHEPAH